MPVTTANIIVGAGTLAVGPYGGATTDVGATRDGVEVSCDRSYLDVSADQYLGTLRKQETNRKYTVKTNLLESTLANLAIAWGYAASAVSGGTFKLGAPASTPEFAVAFVGKGANGKTRTATFPKCVSISSGGHSYKKDGDTVIPVEFEVLLDPSQAAGQEWGTVVDA